MSGRRTAVVTAGLAAGAVAGGVLGRAVLNARRGREGAGMLSLLPPEAIEGVRSADGTGLAVRASGDPRAPILVFVHGFSLDMTTWHFQWTALSERYRCVLFDLRSHGRSERAADGDVSPPAFGRDLAAVLAAVARERPVVLVGHSLGALAILAMAQERPDVFVDRVAGAVFVGAAMNDLWRGAMGSLTGLLRPRLGSLRQAAGRVNALRRHVLAGGPDVGHLVARLTQFGPDAPRPVVDHIVSLAARAPSHVWTDGLAALVDADLRDAVRHVRVPALVVAGEHDRMTPPSAAVALAGELPQGRLEVLPDVGHVPMLERPEAFNALVDSFAGPLLRPAAPRRKRPA
jgi:pimeloyl-ACP methyl ester carboxylesterase